MPDYIFNSNNQNKDNMNNSPKDENTNLENDPKTENIENQENAENPEIKNEFVYPNHRPSVGEIHKTENEEQPSQPNHSSFTRPQSTYSQVPDKETFSPVYITPKAADPNPNSYISQRGESTSLNGYSTSGSNQRKPKKSRTVPVVAALCTFAVLFSGLAGFGGTMLANQMNENSSSYTSADKNDGTNSSSYSQDDAGVIYRSVATNTGLNGTSSGTGTVASVAAAVENSVVEIVTEYQNMSSFFQYVSEGAGSGVIITSDGYIVTNNHVIAGSSSGTVADKITVRLKNGEEYEAKVIGTDSSSDVALLKIEATGLIPAIFGDSNNLIVGEDVVAVGNPLGELGGTVTDGIISALDRAIDVDGTTMNLLQTNAAVNPGNSGGGLFNMHGELIGIVNAKSSGSGIEGLGFAIPSNDVLKIVEQLKDFGYVRGRVFLGLSFLNITDSMTAQYYRVNALGVYVGATTEGYNDKVLQAGDRVTAVNGKEIASSNDIKNLLAECEVGDILKFTVIRNGEQMDIEVTCYELVPEGVAPVDFGA